MKYHDIFIRNLLEVFKNVSVKLVMKAFYLLCCVELSRSVVSDSATPWTAAHQAPLPMGILQARILEWIGMPSSRGSSQPRDGTQVSHIASGFFTVWDTREVQEYWSEVVILTDLRENVTIGLD